ncbi:MAG: tRNA dimethylallyltransferase [Desulforhopalus sp.]
MENKIKAPQVLVLIGPTAIGKTALSLDLALRFNCEIISVDSMQVYRFMDIGTAKASLAERALVPHHLIDVVDPDEDYDAARFTRDATELIREITSRGKLPLLTGGTGLYLKSLLDGIFPEAPSDKKVRAELKVRLESEGAHALHEELIACDSISATKIHMNDTQRLLRALEVFHTTGVAWSTHLAKQNNKQAGGVPVDALQIGLTCDRKKLYERINMRCDLMIQGGLEGEVLELIQRGYSPELKSMGSIGYRHMAGYINSTYTREEMVRLLARDTRRYAKRQYTWFNNTKDVKWVDVKDGQSVTKLVKQWRKMPS